VKIALVSDDGLTISHSFDRAKFYIVICLEDNKVVAREQRQRIWFDLFTVKHNNEQKSSIETHHPNSRKYPSGKYYHLLAAIADCNLLLAQGMRSGAYYQALQVGIRPIITDISMIDDALLAVMDGSIIDHKGKLR